MAYMHVRFNSLLNQMCRVGVRKIPVTFPKCPGFSEIPVGRFLESRENKQNIWESANLEFWKTRVFWLSYQNVPTLMQSDKNITQAVSGINILNMKI